MVNLPAAGATSDDPLGRILGTNSSVGRTDARQCGHERRRRKLSGPRSESGRSATMRRDDEIRHDVEARLKCDPEAGVDNRLFVGDSTLVP
jgi:hypothetical protein